MHPRFFRLLTAVAIVTLFIPGCAPQNDEGEREEPTIRIGAILSTSGRYSVIDTPTKEAVTYFFERRRGDSKVAFQLDILDAGSDPLKAVEKLAELYARQPEPRILLLSTSSIAMSVVPHLRDRELLVIANAGHPDLIESSNPYTFSTFPDLRDECGLFLRHLNDVDASRVYLVHANDVYHQADAAFLTSKLEARIVGDDQYQEGTTDFGPLVTRIRASDADVVVVFGFGISYPAILAELVRRNYGGRILVDTDFLSNPLSNYPDSSTNRLVFVGPTWLTEPSQDLAAYQEATGEPIKYFATFIADGLLLAMEAAEKDASVPEMARYLTTVSDRDLLSGKVTVGADHHFRYNLGLYTLSDVGDFIAMP